jgi:hypothetical protein
MDEQWQYVGCHAGRMAKKEKGRGDLGSLTTSHVERVFLSVRQELKRFQRKGLGYSKDLATHKAAVALFLGVYNFVRNTRRSERRQQSRRASS